MATQYQTAEYLERGPFTVIPDFVFDLGLSPQAFRVYMHLKTLHDLGNPSDGVRETAQICLMSQNTVRRGLRELETFDLVLSVPPMTALAARDVLITKAPQGDTGLTAQCSWCHCRTAWLHGHHFPVPQSEGGTETVDICPNCHAEFHALTRSRYQIAESEG